MLVGLLDLISFGEVEKNAPKLKVLHEAVDSNGSRYEEEQRERLVEVPFFMGEAKELQAVSVFSHQVQTDSPFLLSVLVLLCIVGKDMSNAFAQP